MHPLLDLWIIEMSIILCPWKSFNRLKITVLLETHPWKHINMEFPERPGKAISYTKALSCFSSEPRAHRDHIPIYDWLHTLVKPLTSWSWAILVHDKSSVCLQLARLYLQVILGEVRQWWFRPWSAHAKKIGQLLVGVQIGNSVD
jgi:hypothetical protein